MAQKKKKPKKKALIASLNPIHIFGKRNVLMFIFSVLAIAFVSVGFLVIDTYRIKREITQIQDQKRRLTDQEYQILLQTPTIHDYIFPHDPTNFRVTIEAWRHGRAFVTNEDEFNLLWIDPRSLEWNQLPDKSRQNLVDYIQYLREQDPHF
ncbi:hypothetical protein PVA44_02560 [Entomospira nematocerorum]|uniref:Uncharacterized protein n=1 Tax=Entomospira nematocerorum TaxID=2719987 RepID=A0A968GC56_9SPIO|nr:hypothetical protein [Entomospira nematocera]NIZ47084.1 hypothetical protein [Entomospira nematocera]WDI34371.1 hypothetical protein PVA44_02560 [Entomospira nematocera]